MKTTMNESEVFVARVYAGEMVSVFIDNHDIDDWFYVRTINGSHRYRVRSCDIFHNCARLLSSYADFQD